MMEQDHSREDSMYYNYPIKSLLIKEPSMFTDTDEYLQVNLVVYSINQNGKYPFIQYLLSNNSFGRLSFLTLPKNYSFNNNNLISYSKVFLSGILQVIDYEHFDCNLFFDGFYEFGNILYLFFDLTKCAVNINDIYLSSICKFVLPDEIINHRHCCNVSISEETTSFYIRNQLINYLYDEDNKQYELPIVGYVGKPTQEKLNFVYTFGESAKNKSAILGPYFYFTDFNFAVRQGGWSPDYAEECSYGKFITDENGKYLKGGIVRFALFTGKTKCIENMPNDPNDESEIKAQRLNDNFLNNKNEALTLRISDHDGLWSDSYDSVYLAKIELDDGSILEEAPLIVVKEHNQQIPLSYHFIDKRKLGAKYDPKNNNYSIA